MKWNENTGIDEVIAYPGFGDWGRLIFPADEGYYSGSTLKDLRLTWYSNIQPAKTVEIVNYFKEKADAGETVFYDIYTDAEKATDPWKADTGLFFFKGNPGAKFAICNAGGGFAYVGAMHDSFPHALELSKNDDVLFGEVWAREEQLSARDRSIITIAALFSAGLYPQLKSHLVLGKAHGITKQEAVEIVTQLAFYCGWPKAWSTFPMIDEVWPEEEAK